MTTMAGATKLETEGAFARERRSVAKPRFLGAVRRDAAVTRSFRGEGDRAPTRAREVLDAIRLVWVSDAFGAQVAWRAADALTQRRIPVLPRVLRWLARRAAQVDIDPAATIAPGLYLAHGQVKIRGAVTIDGSVVIFPWVTIEAEPGAVDGPRIERGVHVGTGATVRGRLIVGAGARVGANAQIHASVAPGAVAVGVVAEGPEGQPSDVRPGQGLGAHELDANSVDELSAANRLASDPQVEQRLLQLRHATYATVEREAPSVSSWPPPHDNRFAEVPGIPEVDAAALTGEVIRAGVVGRGALIVRGLLPGDTARRIIDHVDRAFAGQDAWAAAGEADGDYGPWFAPFEPAEGYPPMSTPRHWVGGGGGVFAADSPRAAFHVLEAFAEAGIVDAVAGHLGERPALSGKKWTLRRVPLTAGTSWHQDGAFLGEALRTVNVWIALSSAGDVAPGLEVVARRFDEILPTGTEGAFFDWSVSDAVARDAAGEHPIVRPVFTPGDAILFDDMTLHRTLITAAMTEPRYAIESWFFAPSAYPDGGVPLVP